MALTVDELRVVAQGGLDFGQGGADTPSVARVVIEHLSKYFEGPKGERICAVEDMSLTVEDRELLVLVGPSGCGKTTTLRLIAGLEEPDGGTISIDGQAASGLEPKERDVAMVFQNYALYPHMSVYENLAFGLKLRRVPRAEIERRVREAAEVLGLEGCLDRKPMEISGGQQQRVAVGRAMVRQPRLLLFDEPWSHLDPQMRVQMRSEIARLHRRQEGVEDERWKMEDGRQEMGEGRREGGRLGATMLYVTHDQAEAMTLGDRIAVMREGRIQQVDEPLTVYEKPANLFVAGFIGSPRMNFFRGTAARKSDGLFFQVAVVEDFVTGSAPFGWERGGREAGDKPVRKPVLLTEGFGVRLDETASAQIGTYVGKPIVLGIRPEHVGLCFRPDDGAPGRVVKAMVEVVEPLGPETHVHLARGAVRFVARIQGGERVKAGEEVRAVFKAGCERFFDEGTGTAVRG